MPSNIAALMIANLIVQPAGGIVIGLLSGIFMPSYFLAVIVGASAVTVWIGIVQLVARSYWSDYNA